MGKNRLDRRIVHTRKALRQALIKKLADTPINQVSIKSLCEIADINRSTFYAHYTDQHDLLRQLENELLVVIIEYLESNNDGKCQGPSIDTITKILDYIYENRELCMVLLGENGHRDFITMVMSKLQHCSFADPLSADLNGRDPILFEYYYTYITSGSIAVVQKWFASGFRESPSVIARLITDLAVKGIEQAGLGLNDYAT